MDDNYFNKITPGFCSWDDFYCSKDLSFDKLVLVLGFKPILDTYFCCWISCLYNIFYCKVIVMFKKKCKHEYEVIINEKIYEIEKKSLFDHYPSLFNTSTTTVNFSDELIELLKNKDITKDEILNLFKNKNENKNEETKEKHVIGVCIIQRCSLCGKIDEHVVYFDPVKNRINNPFWRF